MLPDELALEAQIVEFVGRLKSVSFVNLREELGPDVFDGECSLSIAENLILWTGMSELVVSVLCRITKQPEGSLKLKPVPVLYYLIDGQTLRLPVAKSVRPYKKPRWLPACLDLA